MKVALVILAIILPGLMVQAAQVAQVPDGTKVENVRIEGNKRIPSDSIKYRIQTKPGGVLNMSVIRRDVKELYAQNLFDDIRVDAEDGKTGGVVIVFTVKEKPLIRSVDFPGSELDYPFRYPRQAEREKNQHQPGIAL